MIVSGGPLRRLTILAISLSLVCQACVEGTPSHDVKPREEPEQELQITFGGFIQNGPEDQLLDGQCVSDAARNVLGCDIHNGFVNWNITEVTFQVILTGDVQHHPHYYRERMSIAPLKTEHVDIRLAMQLPPDDQLKIRGKPFGKPLSHWDWLIVGAKGKHPAE
jgi:hypothetical protein